MKQYEANYNFFEAVANDEKSETLDGYEGSLIDNYLISAADGIYFFREIYKTCWSSAYMVYQFDFSEGKAAFNLFYNCQNEAIKANG